MRSGQTGSPSAKTGAEAPRSVPARGALGWWLVAQVVGLAGTRLINVAVPWFVLVTTRDPRLAGVVAFAQLGPLVLSKALAGPLIDRVGAARVAVTCDLASCLAVAAIPLLHIAGLLSWPLLVVVAAVEGALRGPGDSSKYAMCPALAEVTALPLERVTGLANTVDRIGSATGAAFGGLLIAVVGAPLALLLSCLTFASAAACIGLRVGPTLASGRRGVLPDAAGAPAGVDRAHDVSGAAPTPTPTPTPTEGAAERSTEARAAASTEETTAASTQAPTAAPTPVSTDVGADAGASYWTRLGQGWRVVRRDPVLVAITTMVALTNLLDQSYLTVLVPEWAIQKGLGADALGVFFGVMTGSAIFGSAIATAIGDRLPKLPTYVVCFALGGAPRFLAFAADLPRPGLIAVLAVSGLASGFINPLLGAVIFSRIPVDMVGRVSSLITALCWLLMPFGGMVGATLILGLGMAPALWVCGIGYLVVTMAPAVLPAFRAMDDTRR